MFTYLNNRYAHVEHVLAGRAELAGLGVVLERRIVLTHGAVEVAQVPMRHLPASQTCLFLQV